jgi:hypothetical protein
MEIRNAAAWSRCVAAIALGLCVASCEDDKSAASSAPFRIDPRESVLTEPNQRVVLRAIGGHLPMRWRVSTNSLGWISGGGGDTVTYVSSAVKGVNEVTVTDAQQWTAKAIVIQKEKEVIEPLTIAPTAGTINNNGGQIVFTAKGGKTPYGWSVSDGNLGSIASKGKTLATYTRRAAGQNSVILTDSRGAAAIATVTQPAVPAGTALKATASATTLNAPGEKATIAASGGTPPYTWTVLDVALGHFLSGASTDANVVYVRDGRGENVVRLRDSAGSTFDLLITQP